MRRAFAVLLAALALGLSCKSAATRARDTAADFRCPAARPQAFDYCGMPDEARGHASDDDCVPWPVRPPNMWMAFCCPEPETDTGIGACR